ncbi:MAG: hypothetical protein DRH12_10075 [Deltaproteobacteria bacterium]|nr:MAG: hypothetical protein DRH12_10075 [Deltaproteobacteria bacterium]
MGASEIRKVMERAGLRLPDNIVLDGQIHRFPTNGRPGDKAGFYCFWDHGDGFVTGFFGDWRRGIHRAWHSKQKHELNAVQRERMEREIKEAKKAAEAERRRVAYQAKSKARLLWGKGEPAHSHPYIARKQIKAPGIRQLKNLLLVPVMDSTGDLHGLQLIRPDGSKRFLRGTLVSGHFFKVGEGEPLYICEGYATAASIYEAIEGQGTIIVAFNAGNTEPVAKVIREANPSAKIIICADDDASTPGNPGLTKATEAAKAIGALLAVPKFHNTSTKLTDFNDLHQLEGLEAVRDCLDKAKYPDLSEQEVEAELDRLAALSPVQYDKTREEAAKRLGVRVSTLDQEVKRRRVDQKATLYTASFEGLVDLVMDDEGRVAFLYKGDTGTLKIRHSFGDPNGHVVFPPPTEGIPFDILPAKKILKAAKDDNDLRLYQDLVEQIKPISVLPADEYHHLCAVYVLFTYLPEVMPYYPYLYFFGLPERGKSRIAKALTHLSFRGFYTESLNEAYLFRFADLFHGTICLDLYEVSERAKKSGSYDLLLTRFEKGGKVPRVIHPDKGPFEDTRYFGISGPTILATNVEIPPQDPLSSRCIKVTMPEARGVYPNINEEELRGLRVRLTAFRARHLGEELPKVDKPVAGRLGDITHPLLCVAQLLPQEASDAILGLVSTLEEARKQAESESLAGRIAEALFSLRDEVRKGRLAFSKLQQAINSEVPEKYQFSPQRIARELSAMGIHRKKSHGTMQIVWEAKTMHGIFSRFGLGGSLPSLPNLPKAGLTRISEGDEKKWNLPIGYPKGEEGEKPKTNVLRGELENTRLGDEGELGDESPGDVFKGSQNGPLSDPDHSPSEAHANEENLALF